MPKRQEMLFRRIVSLGDIVALLVSYVTAYLVRGYFLDTWYGSLFPFAEYLWILWLIVPIWLFWLSSVHLYEAPAYRSLREMLGRLLQAHLLAGMTLFAVIYIARAWSVSRLLLQAFLVIALGILTAEKIAVQLVLGRLRAGRSHQTRKVLVVGSDAHTERVFHLLQEHPHWRTEVIGFLSSGVQDDAQRCGKPVFGHMADFPQVLRSQIVDEVIAVSPWEGGIDLEALALTCTERGITFRVLAEMPSAQVARYRVEELKSGLYFLSLETIPQGIFSLLAKRLLDIAGASVGLVVCAFTYVWFAPKIRRESPGPVLFRQTRVGQNGRLFTLHKFRTMCPDAEERLRELLPTNQMRGPLFKIHDDPRITPTGEVLRRRYLDELPQFWNVLKGEMSLVGTRPPTPREVAHYRPAHHRRISFKPGLTGLWQLSGNNTVSDFDEVVRLDCEYIDNWSLWLDCKILARTVVKVLRGDGW